MLTLYRITAEFTKCSCLKNAYKFASHYLKSLSFYLLSSINLNIKHLFLKNAYSHEYSKLIYIFKS